MWKLNRWFCFTLTTGNVIIGWATLVFGMIETIACLRLYSEMTCTSDRQVLPIEKYLDLSSIVALAIVFVMRAISGGVLIMAASKKRDRLTLPWLILHSLFLIVIAFTVLILIFMSLYQKDTEVYVGLIVFPLCFGFWYYSWAAVYSFRSRIRKIRKAARQHRISIMAQQSQITNGNV